jgi:hypothetical protein
MSSFQLAVARHLQHKLAGVVGRSDRGPAAPVIPRHLSYEEIRGRLDRRVEPLLGERTVEPEGNTRALRQRVDSGGEALFREHRRIEPVCQLSKLSEQLAHLLLRAPELRITPPALGDGETDRKRQSHEPLLRTVVQIALEPPAFLVAGLDDASSRGPQLLELRAQLRLEALVVERKASRGHDLLAEAWVVEEPLPVCDDCQRAPPPRRAG